jgi:hypothetical protein
VAYATLNGVPVFTATICFPRVGAWTADVACDQDAAVVGPCTIAIDGGLTLRGTAARTGVWLGTARLQVVAGADGLRKTATPRHYRQTTLRLVLQDLLAAAGEKLSPTADAATLALSFPGWTTIAQPVGRMLAALLEDTRIQATASWRMLADGTLWVGRETWPDWGQVSPTDYQDLAERPEEGTLELGVEAPQLLPGMTVGGRRVSYVEHRLNGDGARTFVWLED